MASQRICPIPGCGKAPVSLGWCDVHYQRWRRHGDPLGSGKWGKARAYFNEVVPAYEGDECLTWPFCKNQKGYGQLGSGVGSKIVSRIVCEETNGPPPTPAHEAAHSCGKGHLACVTKRHLSWKTHADNEADKIAHGTINRGERHGMAKLSEPEARQILALKGIKSQIKIAAQFHVSNSLVSLIHRKMVWGWLEGEADDLRELG